MRDEIDEAIATYTHELQAEASLARADVVEIEDHLRSLIDELRAHQPLGVAIAQAKRRLGEPRALAREHARVSGSFGPPLSRWRAVSAVALLVPMLWSAFASMRPELTVQNLEIVTGLMLAVGLLSRRGWARPVMFAGAAFWVIPMSLVLYAYPEHTSPIWLVLHLGIVAFLAPWRRREVTQASVALALQVWAVASAMMVLGFQITTPDGGTEYVTPAAMVAMIAASKATVGGILRARWGALASLVSAATLAVSIYELQAFTFKFANAGAYQLVTFGMLASGVLASLAASVLLWRHARSAFGSLREVFAS